MTTNNDYLIYDQTTTSDNFTYHDYRYIPSQPTSTANNISITYPQYYQSADGTSIIDRFEQIEMVEKAKLNLGLEDFCIFNEGNKYLFLTLKEMELFRKYNFKDKQLDNSLEFDNMLIAINLKMCKLFLNLTKIEYDTIEDLRKDYLVLKLSGIE